MEQLATLLKLLQRSAARAQNDGQLYPQSPEFKGKFYESVNICLAGTNCIVI